MTGRSSINKKKKSGGNGYWAYQTKQGLTPRRLRKEERLHLEGAASRWMSYRRKIWLC